MKKSIFFLTSILFALTTAAKNRIIKTPTVEYTPHWICVNEIEFAKEATIFRCDLRHRPHWWVELDGTEHLKDRNSDRVWKILKVEGFELKKRVTMPDEGRVPCVIYFEPIPADVKEVNFMGSENPTMEDMFGIQLTPPSKTKTKEFVPREMTAEYYLSQPFTPDTDWHFSSTRYRDLKFYNPGRAHVEIQIDHLPKELRENFSSISVTYEEQILRRKTTLSSEMNAENRYVFDLNLNGPMTMNIMPFGDFFIQPDDSLEIFLTAEHDPYGDSRYKAFRSNSETAIINAMRKKIIDKMGLPETSSVYRICKKAVDNGKESSEKLAENWGAIAERIIISEEIRQILINTPLSTFGKDLMMTFALGKMAQNIEDIHLYYEDTKYIRERDENGKVTTRPDSSYVPLDKNKVYGAMLRHRELLYDNPLALSTGWAYVNRTLFGGLFNNYEQAMADNENVYNIKEIDPFGMRGTFMYDLRQSQFAASSIDYILQNVQLGKKQPSEALNLYNPSIADCMAKISYKSIAEAVLNEYRTLVAQLEGGKKVADEDKWSDEQKALWKKLTEPYADNLLFIDFWGMGCSPCRSGMISMRDKVEALKDDTIRFLYVCDEKYSPRPEAEKWMSEQEIKGEHIYVSHDEWNQFQQMFNFTGIPHAVIADKQARVIQNGFFISSYTADQLREMITKF